MIGRLENREYMPSIPQLEKLAEVLGFNIPDLYVENEPMISLHSGVQVCQKKKGKVLPYV